MSVELLELAASALGELLVEVEASPADLRAYLAREFIRHQTLPRFLDGIYAGLLPDDASQARAELIVLPRIASIVSAEGS